MRTPFIHLLVPCAPRAFCTGEAPRWYWKAARDVRRKTLEKLDMAEQSQDAEEAKARQLARMAMLQVKTAMLKSFS